MILTRSDYKAIKNNAIKNNSKHIQIEDKKVTLSLILDLEEIVGSDIVYEELIKILKENINE